MPNFNLVDEKWIPCLMAPDGKAQDLGLKDTLARAQEIREIFDPSPLVTAALHRLLLAILCRVFSPANLEDWKAIWRHGRWDAQSLDRYFQKARCRFFLLDEAAPFYQHVSFSTKKETPLKRLAFEFAAQNNATLFDHSSDDDRPGISPACAARWLLTAQTFAPSAGKSETIHTKDSAWSRGAVILMQGDNLFETLALNLLNLFSGDVPALGEDRPAWENAADFKPEHRVTPNGLLEYMTMQSRSIRLLPGLHGCYYAQGRATPDDFRDDPMLAYRRNEEEGWIVWALREDHAVWRDSHALFCLEGGGPFRLPRAFNRTSTLVRDGFLERRRRFQLSVLGQQLESGQPTIHFWRHERLPLPLPYLDKDAMELLNTLKGALAIAENLGKQLNWAGSRLAQLVLFPNKGETERLGTAQSQEVKRFLASLAPGRLYWSRLEAPFRELLVALPEDQREQDGIVQYGIAQLPVWKDILRRAARDAFDEVANGLDRDARTLKAISRAERFFTNSLRKILGPVENERREVPHEQPQ